MTAGLRTFQDVSTLWIQGTNLRGIIKKWGNIAAVRIPASILESLKVEIEVDDIGDLIDHINRKNLHDEPDFGPPQAMRSGNATGVYP